MDSQGRILYLGATSDSNDVPLPGAPNAGSGLAESGSLVGRGVAKSGRSTGLTCAPVSSVGTTLLVTYPSGCNSSGTFSETFNDQIVVDGETFSAPGDSGSLIVGAGPHAVIGCSLPTAPAHATSTAPLSAVSNAALQTAIAVCAAHASELMGHPEVQALGVGASQDHPGEPAIIIFVTAGTARDGIPQQVDGVRTRIAEGDLFEPRGLLTVDQTAAAAQQVQPVAPSVSAISNAEYERAKAVHAARVDEWMRKSGVQRVGVSSSADSPGEAALMIFLLRGVAHEPIPPSIDGVRTRIRESSPFLAGVAKDHSNTGCKVQSTKHKT